MNTFNALMMILAGLSPALKAQSSTNNGSAKTDTQVCARLHKDQLEKLNFTKGQMEMLTGKGLLIKETSGSYVLKLGYLKSTGLKGIDVIERDPKKYSGVLNFVKDDNVTSTALLGKFNENLTGTQEAELTHLLRIAAQHQHEQTNPGGVPPVIFTPHKPPKPRIHVVKPPTP